MNYHKKITNRNSAIKCRQKTYLQNGNYHIQIRVTFKGKQKYYGTGIKISMETFTNSMTSLKKSNEAKKIHRKLMIFQNKADECLEKNE